MILEKIDPLFKSRILKFILYKQPNILKNTFFHIIYQIVEYI